MRLAASVSVLAQLVLLSCRGGAGGPAEALPSCEWCGAQDAPADLGWSATLAPADEPGEPLEIRGSVLQPGGGPAHGVLVYVYHTNARGIYPKRGDERGNGRRHGYLRGWLRTGADGRYAFRTIRPAPYPGRTEPAHIHVTLTPRGGAERWLDSFVFADDPLVDEDYRRRMEGRGGPGAVVELVRGGDGVWRGARDLRLDE